MLIVKDTGIRRVEIGLVEGRVLQSPDAIARLGCDERVHVRANVPAAEGVEIPIGFDGGDLRVVVVEVGVGRSDQLLRDRVAQQDREYPVLLRVFFVLVECWNQVG